MEQGLDFWDGRVLARGFLNRTYDAGPLGSMFIDEDGERQNKVCLCSFDNNTRDFTVSNVF